MLKDIIKGIGWKLSLSQLALLLLGVYICICFIQWIAPKEYQELLKILGSNEKIALAVKWIKYYPEVDKLLGIVTGIMFIAFFFLFTLHDYYWIKKGFNADLYPRRRMLLQRSADLWFIISTWYITIMAYSQLFQFPLMPEGGWILKSIVFLGKMSGLLSISIVLFSYFNLLFSRKS